MKIRNFWKWTLKSILSAAQSPRKCHVHCMCFENATSRANTNVMSTSCFYVCYRDGPGRQTVKAAKQVYNSTWIALLKHGFVLVQTWLLIACGIGFYAILYCRKWNWRVPYLTWKTTRKNTQGHNSGTTHKWIKLTENFCHVLQVKDSNQNGMSRLVTKPTCWHVRPVHPPGLIRVFAVRMKKAWVLNYPLSAQWRLWSD